MRNQEHPELVSFTYRLPATFVRIAGTRTLTQDRVTQANVTEVKALATTSVSADLGTCLKVDLSVSKDDTSNYLWKLMDDGRVREVSLDSTVSRLGIWPTVAKVGGFALSAALPMLIPGPAGFIAAITAAGQSMAPRRGASGESLDRSNLEPEPDDGGGSVTPEETAEPSDPALEEYTKTSKEAAQTLVALRRATALAETAQSNLVEPLGPDNMRLAMQASRLLERLRTELDRAESLFRAWRTKQVTTTVKEFDETFRIEDLPSTKDLKDILAQTPATPFATFVRQWGVAVTADRCDCAGDDPIAPDVASGDDFVRSWAREVCYRQPRRALLKVWRVKTVGDLCIPSEISCNEVDVPWRGNEERLPLDALGNSGKVGYTFTDSGALTELSTNLTGTRRQVAGELDTLISGISSGAEYGQKLRDALAPPSLVDQAAAQEALGKLTPAEPEDPETVAARKELAAAQLRAQLRVADQLANATTPPQFVVFSSTT